MTEKGYKGGLVSWVRNQQSGKKYLISTAQEIGKTYWCTVVHPRVFFALIPNVFRKDFVVTRNNMEEAQDVHREVKEIVTTAPETKWFELMPDPMPPQGWSADALEIIERKLNSK